MMRKVSVCLAKGWCVLGGDSRVVPDPRSIGEDARAAYAQGNFREVEPPLKDFNDAGAIERAFLDVFNCSYQRLIGSKRLTGVQHKAYADAMFAAFEAAKKMGAAASSGSVIEVHQALIKGKIPFKAEKKIA